MCEHRRDANIQNLLPCSIFSTTQPYHFVYRERSEQGFYLRYWVGSGGNVKAPEPNATSGELEFGVHSARTTIDRYNISSHTKPASTFHQSQRYVVKEVGWSNPTG